MMKSCIFKISTTSLLFSYIFKNLLFLSVWRSSFLLVHVCRASKCPFIHAGQGNVPVWQIAFLAHVPLMRNNLSTLWLQVPVAQMSDSAIHHINYYPPDKYWGTSCVIYWIEIYPVDSFIHLLNNWGLVNN